MNSRSKLIVLIIICVFSSINVMNIIRVEYLPFIDVPNHLAEATIYRYYEYNELFQKYYNLNIHAYPNTFHVFFYSLPIFKDIEFANKILHLFLVVSIPFLIFILIIKVKGNIWFSLLSFFYVYNYNLTYGFLGNVLAIIFLLIFVYLWIDYIEKPRVIIEFLMAAVLIIIFFSHAMISIFSVLLFLIFYIFYSLKVKSKKYIILYVIPSILLLGYWWLTKEASSDNTLNYLLNYYTGEFWINYYKRFRIISLDNFQLFDGLLGIIISSIFTFIVLIPILSKTSIKYLFQIDKTKINIALLKLFFILAVFCYFFSPNSIPGQAPIYSRFSTVLFLSFIPLCSIYYSKKIKEQIIVFLFLLGSMIHTILWWNYFSDFDQEARSFGSLDLTINKNSVLTYFPIDSSFRGRNVFLHFQNYYIVRNKGISTTMIIDYRFGMIRRANGIYKYDSLPVHPEYLDENEIESALKKANYVLVRGEITALNSSLNLNNLEIVSTSGKWYLFSNETHNDISNDLEMKETKPLSLEQ